jgi:hypothetical protein
MTSYIDISIKEQRLFLYTDGELRETYPVSTAKNGPGERNGSECTPRGRHVIFEMIGAGSQEGTVFVARQATGEVYNLDLAQKHRNGTGYSPVS